jgi:hypothetical protein
MVGGFFGDNVDSVLYVLGNLHNHNYEATSMSVSVKFQNSLIHLYRLSPLSLTCA